MKKTEHNNKVATKVKDKIGIYELELANLHNDNTYAGLVMRAELMLKIAELMDVSKVD